MVNALKKMVAALQALSAVDFRQVAATVKEQLKQDDGERARPVERCPHCGATAWGKWGVGRTGLPRFRCKACGVTFNGFTGTPFAYLKQREKLQAHARYRVEGFSIRRTAAERGIPRTPAFSWRHRCLIGSEHRNPSVLGGMVEADETYFLRSFKGRTGLPRPAKKRGRPAAQRGLSPEQIPVLTAQSRSAPPVFSAILPSRKFHDVDAALAPRLAPDVLLMTDGLSAYRKISATHGLAYRAVPPHSQKKTQGMRPLNNINAYHSRLKAWMSRFRGVASRHLANYLGGHRWLDAARQTLTPEEFLAASWG
jgi:transposase-like protein